MTSDADLSDRRSRHFGQRLMREQGTRVRAFRQLTEQLDAVRDHHVTAIDGSKRPPDHHGQRQPSGSSSFTNLDLDEYI